MFYALRVNSAIARLGVRVVDFDSAFRGTMQNLGKSKGYTPQEVALHMVAQLPIVQRTNLDHAMIHDWVRSKKVNVERPEIRDALSTFALFDLLKG
jgi:hypothetical protein